MTYILKHGKRVFGICHIGGEWEVRLGVHVTIYHTNVKLKYAVLADFYLFVLQNITDAKGM